MAMAACLALPLVMSVQLGNIVGRVYAIAQETLAAQGEMRSALDASRHLIAPEGPDQMCDVPSRHHFSTAPAQITGADVEIRQWGQWADVRRNSGGSSRSFTIKQQNTEDPGSTPRSAQTECSSPRNRRPQLTPRSTPDRPSSRRAHAVFAFRSVGKRCVDDRAADGGRSGLARAPALPKYSVRPAPAFFRAGGGLPRHGGHLPASLYRPLRRRPPRLRRGDLRHLRERALLAGIRRCRLQARRDTGVAGEGGGARHPPCQCVPQMTHLGCLLLRALVFRPLPAPRFPDPSMPQPRAFGADGPSRAILRSLGRVLHRPDDPVAAGRRLILCQCASTPRQRRRPFAGSQSEFQRECASRRPGASPDGSRAKKPGSSRAPCVAGAASCESARG